jgi:hypothetical protein
MRYLSRVKQLSVFAGIAIVVRDIDRADCSAFGSEICDYLYRLIYRLIEKQPFVNGHGYALENARRGCSHSSTGGGTGATCIGKTDKDWRIRSVEADIVAVGFGRYRSDCG